jgi:hypothetical protein
MTLPKAQRPKIRIRACRKFILPPIETPFGLQRVGRGARR